MVTRLVIAAVVVLAALVVAGWLRRQKPSAPPRDPYPIPRQLDRADFARPDAEWLVAFFSSETCESCRGLGPKVAALESKAVATCEFVFPRDRELHERYEISAVPMILVTDREGIVQRAFVGATTATDLWAAVAEVRSPGSTPEPNLGSF